MFTAVKSLNTVEQQRQEVQMNTEHITYYPAWFNGQHQTQCQQEPLNGEDVVITGVAGHLNQQGEEMEREQLKFNIMQLEQLETMEPKMINLMTMCQEAIVDCGMGLNKCNGQRTGFFVATSHRLSNQDENKIVKQLLRFFEFSESAYIYSTPKTSSLIALDAAIKALKTGECEQAIVADMHEQRQTASVVFLQLNQAYGKCYAKIVHTKHQCAEEATLNTQPQYPVGEMHSQLLRQIYATSDIDTAIVQTIEKQFNKCIDEVFVPAIAEYSVPIFAGKQKYNLKPQQTGLFSIIKMLKEIEQGCVPANLYYQAPSYKVAQILAQQIKDKTHFFGGLITLNAFGPRGENIHIIIQPNSRFIAARQSEQQWAPLNTFEQIWSSEYNTQELAGLIREGEQQPQKQWRHQVEEQLNSKPQEKKFLQDLIQELEQQWDITRSTLTAYELQQEQEQQKFILEQINQKQQPLNKNKWVQREFVTLSREQQLRQFVNEQIRQEQRQHKQTLIQLIRQQLHQQFPEECIFTQKDKNQKIEYFIAQQIRRETSIIHLIKQKFEAQFPEARILGQEKEQQHVMEQLINEMINEQFISQRRCCTPLYQLISKIEREHNTYQQEQTLSEMDVSGMCLTDLQELLEQLFNTQLTLKQVSQMTVCELNNLERCEEPRFDRKMMPTLTIEKLNNVELVSQKTPLFVIHPVEGQQLNTWASQMQVPVYAVNFTRESMQFETCEELARFYWNQIQQHFNTMPRIHICALTHGASVARAMTLTRPEQVATLSFIAQQDMQKLYISQNEKLNRQIEALCWFVQQQCGNKKIELITFCEELLQLQTKEQKINHTIRRLLTSEPRFQYELCDVKQSLFALLRKVNLMRQYNEKNTPGLANKPVLLIKSSQHGQIEQFFFDGKLQVVTVEGQDKKTLLEGRSGQKTALHMNQFFYRCI